ncbi:MAG: hypothetical protein C5B53_06205 [Candidatus Melainabacteria bacterium]|nr:MAG: hypothetical protein C5B53_06205 [Candidatus Melainabacteria bacterium]
MYRKAIILLLAAWSAGTISLAASADDKQTDTRGAGRPDNAGLAHRTWLAGRIQAESGSNTAALNLFEKAARLAPNEKEYSKSLIWALFEAKKLHGARAAARSAAKKWRDEIEFLELANAPSASYKLLAEELRSRLLKEPDDFQLHLDLARCLSHLRGLDEGFEEIMAAIALAPESLESKIHLLRYLGDFTANNKGAYELVRLTRIKAESLLDLVEQDRALLRTYVIESGQAAPKVCARATGIYFKKYHVIPQQPYDNDASFGELELALPGVVAQNDAKKTASFVLHLLEQAPKHSLILHIANIRIHRQVRNREIVAQADQVMLTYQKNAYQTLVADNHCIDKLTNPLERRLAQVWRAEIGKVWGVYDIVLGRLADAEKWLKYSIDYVDNDPVTWVHLSQAAEALHHRELAISACDKAMKLAEQDPRCMNDASYWELVARLQSILGQDFGKSARKAFRLDPKENMVLMDDLRKRDFKQMANDLELYVSKGSCPADARTFAQTGIGQALAAKAESDAVAIYTKVSRYLDFTESIYCAVAGAYVKAGHVQSAIKVISTAIEKNPKEAIYRKFRSSLWLIDGNKKSAEQDVRIAVALGDSNFSMERALDVAKRLKGSLSDSDLELLGRKTNRIRSDPNKVDPLHEAEICITQGRYREAYDLAKKRLSEGCDRIRAIRIMAMAAEATGDKKQAAELRDQIVRTFHSTGSAQLP